MVFGGVWVIFLVSEGHLNHFHLNWSECTVNQFLWLCDPFLHRFLALTKSKFYSIIMFLRPVWKFVWLIQVLEWFFGGVWVIFLVPESNFNHFHLGWSGAFGIFLHFLLYFFAIFGTFWHFFWGTIATIPTVTGRRKKTFGIKLYAMVHATDKRQEADIAT